MTKIEEFINKQSFEKEKIFQKTENSNIDGKSKLSSISINFYV